MFKNQVINDLFWVVSSFPIVNTLSDIEDNEILVFDNKFCEIEKKLLWDKFIELDKNPTEIKNFLQLKNNILLGKYFESLVEYWFKVSKNIQLIEVSKQIKSRKATIGEIDFLIKFKERIFHVEVAGKFFLAKKNNSDIKYFFGPNTIDNFKDKLNYIINKQLKLSESVEFRETFSHLIGNEKVYKGLLFKGYLFFHLNNYVKNNYSIPSVSGKEVSKGWWIRFSEFDLLLRQFKESKFLILKRELWISEVFNTNMNELNSADTFAKIVRSYFDNNSYPILVVIVKNENNLWIEWNRGFITSNNW